MGYIVDCTVCTTAPWGDRWRTVCRYSISAAADPSACLLRIEYCMAYAKPMPSWMRRVLEPAAESGISKNFTQVIQVLSRFVTLSDAAAEPEAVAAVAEAAPVQAPEVAPQMASQRQKAVELLTAAFGARLSIAPVATVFVDDHLLDLFLPLAERIVGGLAGRKPMPGGLGVRSVASVLSMLLLGYVLQLILWLWHWIGGVCADRSNALARMFLRLHSSLDLPHSVAGLLMAIGLLFAVKHFLGGVAKVSRLHFLLHVTSCCNCMGVLLPLQSQQLDEGS
jgi:hypothetical protein